MKCQVSAWSRLDSYCTFWKPYEIWEEESNLILIWLDDCMRCECWNIFNGSEYFLCLISWQLGPDCNNCYATLLQIMFKLDIANTWQLMCPLFIPTTQYKLHLEFTLLEFKHQLKFTIFYCLYLSEISFCWEIYWKYFLDFLGRWIKRIDTFRDQSHDKKHLVQILAGGALHCL